METTGWYASSWFLGKLQGKNQKKPKQIKSDGSHFQAHKVDWE